MWCITHNSAWCTKVTYTSIYETCSLRKLMHLYDVKEYQFLKFPTYVEASSRLFPNQFRATCVVAWGRELNCSYGWCTCFSIPLKKLVLPACHNSESWNGWAHYIVPSRYCHYEITYKAYNESRNQRFLYAFGVDTLNAHFEYVTIMLNLRFVCVFCAWVPFLKGTFSFVFWYPVLLSLIA